MSMAAVRLDTRDVAALMKALADETRLRIVALLVHGELCVCHLEAALDLSQPNASRHLAILRAAGVVEPRRDGNWIHYRLVDQADPHRARILQAVVGGFERRDLLRRDVERLQRARGPGACG
jgi:ArsR family transcriptional regulator